MLVQNIRQARRRPTKMGVMGMFSGMLYCEDCGSVLYQCRATGFRPEQEFYNCARYHKDSKACISHSIRTVMLEELVLLNLREAIQYVSQYEADFIRETTDASAQRHDRAFAQKKTTLAQSDKRIAELDHIIKCLYEDSITGKLSDERFAKLSLEYEQEQESLKTATDILREELQQQEQKKSNAKNFVAAVRKYTNMEKLDATVLREFIDKIFISKTTGKKGRQKADTLRDIEIVYNFISAFDFSKVMEQSKSIQTTKEIDIA